MAELAGSTGGLRKLWGWHSPYKDEGCRGAHHGARRAAVAGCAFVSVASMRLDEEHAAKHAAFPWAVACQQLWLDDEQGPLHGRGGRLYYQYCALWLRPPRDPVRNPGAGSSPSVASPRCTCVWLEARQHAQEAARTLPMPAAVEPQALLRTVVVTRRSPGSMDTPRLVRLPERPPFRARRPVVTASCCEGSSAPAWSLSWTRAAHRATRGL